MNPDKKIIVEDLLDRLNSSPYLLVIDYGGLTVSQFRELRKRLAENGAQCHVTKNTFLKKATSEVGMPEEIHGFLSGQTATVTGDQEIVGAAKVLKTFHAEFAKPGIRAGVLDGRMLDEDQVRVLASLPSREALLAQFLGLLNQPASTLVRLLNEPAASLARVLQAKADKGDAA